MANQYFIRSVLLIKTISEDFSQKALLQHRPRLIIVYLFLVIWFLCLSSVHAADLESTSGVSEKSKVQSTVPPPAPPNTTPVLRADEILGLQQEKAREEGITGPKSMPQPSDSSAKSSERIPKRKDTGLRIISLPGIKVGQRIEAQADQVLVRFKPTIQDDEKPARLSQHKSVAIERKTPALRKIGYHRVQIPTDVTIADFLALLSKDPAIEHVEPNVILRSNAEKPSEPSFGVQWGLEAIRAEQAWEITEGDPSVIVAILDSGVALEHPSLISNLVPGYNFIDDNIDAQDDFGHGTQVAGIIGAQRNEEFNTIGVAPRSRMMPLKVLDANGEGTAADVAEAIVYAADSGTPIITLALGTYSESAALKAAVEYASTKKCLIIAAGGNNGTAEPVYPAAYPETLAVAALDQFLKPCFFSNQASYIDIAAPGKEIYTISLNGEYEKLTGTSAAAAFVSGLAALIISNINDLSNEKIEAIIRGSASDLGNKGWDTETGAGIINCAKAINFPQTVLNDIGIVAFSVSPERPNPGQKVNIFVSIRNHGNLAAQNVRFVVRIDDQPVIRSVIPAIAPKEINEMQFSWQSPQEYSINGGRLIAQVEPLEKEIMVDDNIRITHVYFTDQTIHDIAILDCKTQGAPLEPGSTVILIATVINLGNQHEHNVPVDLLFQNGHSAATTQFISLPPGEKDNVRFSWEIPSYIPGIEELLPLYIFRVSLGQVPDEEIFENNEFYVRFGLSRRRNGIVIPFHAVEEGEHVHQWIAKEGYDYFISQIEGADITAYIGTISGSYGDNQNTILEGTAAEDKDDRPPLYQDCSVPGFWDCPYFRHFCAGADDSEINQGYDGYPYYSDYDSAFEQAQNIWQYAIDTYSSNKARAFYFLGHVSHLVADMTVPAHTHNDGHAQALLDGDEYEETIAYSNNFELWVYGGGRSGDWDFRLTRFANLYSLFYRTANYTEDYDSTDKDGDGPPYYYPSDYPLTFHHPENVDRSGGIDIDEITVLGDDLMPYAMRRTADLYRLFYGEVDLSAPSINMTYPASEDVGSPTVRNSLNSFDLTASASDSQSGILKEGFQFSWSYWNGSSWSNWFTVSPSPTVRSVSFTPTQGETYYAFEVWAENGGGRMAASNIKYLRIILPVLSIFLCEITFCQFPEEREVLGNFSYRF